jgi:hypothetical protein
VRLQYALRFDVGSSGPATVSALRKAAARLTERLRGGG